MDTTKFSTYNFLEPDDTIAIRILEVSLIAPSTRWHLSCFTNTGCHEVQVQMPNCHFWTAPSRDHVNLIFLDICMLPRGLSYVVTPSLHGIQVRSPRNKAVPRCFSSHPLHVKPDHFYAQLGPQSLKYGNRNGKHAPLIFNSADMLDCSIIYLFNKNPCHAM